MKRLLDRVLARWYVPNERYADAVTIAARAVMPDKEYIQLKPGVYWPVPATKPATRALCS